MKYSQKKACLQQLRDTFGMADYRPGQKAVVEALLSGRDVVCILPTGAGKSLCWQLPALVHEGLTVVVSPLIALMRDQVQHLQQAGVPAISLDSMMEKAERESALEQIRRGKVRIVLVSPERLQQWQFRKLCRDLAPWMVVVDEAHCIVQWGVEFRPPYRQIGEFLQALPHRPVLCAMTATADTTMQRDICSSLGMRHAKRIQLPHIRGNLRYDVRTTLDVPGEILRISRISPCKTLVFCGTRLGSEKLAGFLCRHGISAAYYHAGLARDQRVEMQEKFRAGEIGLMCSTTAFGMGVDIPDIRRVIHACLPDDLIDYAQQSGRAGRDGAAAECLLLFEPAGLMMKYWISSKVSSEMKYRPVSRWMRLNADWRKLEKLLKVLLTSRCIPAAMAAEMGSRIQPCGRCSACRKSPMLNRIPHFRHMREWQFRLWFLQWQRAEMAKERQLLPGALISDRLLVMAAKQLFIPEEAAVPAEIQRMLAYFRDGR